MSELPETGVTGSCGISQPGKGTFLSSCGKMHIRVLGLNPGPLQERAASALNCLPSLCDPTVLIFMLLYLAVSPASGLKYKHCIIYKVFNIWFNIILALLIIIVISVCVV